MSDYSKDISKLLQDALDKAKELGGVAKLHALIKAEQAKKQEQYYKLGKRYYELYKDTPELDLQEFVEKLMECDSKIEAYKEELANQGDDFTDIEDDVDDIKEDIENDVNDFAEKAESAADEAKDAAETVIDDIAEAADTVKDTAEDIISDINE